MERQKIPRRSTLRHTPQVSTFLTHLEAVIPSNLISEKSPVPTVRSGPGVLKFQNRAILTRIFLLMRIKSGVVPFSLMKMVHSRVTTRQTLTLPPITARPKTRISTWTLVLSTDLTGSPALTPHRLRAVFRRMVIPAVTCWVSELTRAVRWSALFLTDALLVWRRSVWRNLPTTKVSYNFV